MRMESTRIVAWREATNTGNNYTNNNYTNNNRITGNRQTGATCFLCVTGL